MVEDISPVYYAEGERVTTYRLKGRNFSLVPADSVGLYATNNDRPLENIDTQLAARLFRVVVEDDENMVVTNNQPGTHSAPSYLGGIVSADRQNVLWVNDTKPLP